MFIVVHAIGHGYKQVSTTGSSENAAHMFCEDKDERSGLY